MKTNPSATSILVLGMMVLLLASAWFVAPTRSETFHTSSWQVVGQIGGPTSAVAVQDNYAYVGVGLRLIVLDVTNPATPTEVGATAPFPFYVEDIALSGTRAYLAAGGAGLRVVDITDPGNPEELGAWDSPGYAEGVAVVGDTVYLADGPYGLSVIDVSNPADPAPNGSAYGMNYALEVAVSGSHAYIAAAGAGLLVADVSDPAQPVEAGQLDTPGYAYGVAVSGATTYVADAWGGLHAVDASDPEAPDLLGTCVTPGWALDVAVDGDTAYVADGASGLQVIDVSDPAHPQEKGALEMGALARRIAIADSTAYLAQPTDGLFLIDVTIPEEPSESGRYNPFTEARYVAVDGSYAYVAAGFSGLRVVDVSNPAQPREVAAYDTEGTYATGVVISGTIAYIPTYLSGSSPHDLHILDISDPLHPARLSTVDTDGVFREVAVQGQYLYAADEWGLRVIDVADPSAPEEIGFALIGGEQDQASDGVTVDGGWAYVAVAEWGMYIFDITTPSEPRLVGIFDPPSGVTSIAVSAGMAYLSNCFEGLRVVDVSEPASPVEMGHADTPGYSMAVALSGSRAYVSDGGGGLQVVDISDPVSPALADSYDTNGFAYHAAVVDGQIYVADSQGGLVILEQATGLAGTPGSLLPLPQVVKKQPISAAHPVTIPNQVLSTPLADCVVSSAADSGPGTLRWCIDTVEGGDSITFDPGVFDPLNPVTITLLSPLPAVTHGRVTIDASEAGVILDGRGTPAGSSGLMVESDSNTINGLQVVGFPGSGVSISGEATFNRNCGSRSVGGGPLGQGNLLSGNGDAGLSIGGTGAMSNTVLGNLIGTDARGTDITGSQPLGNPGHGMVFSAGPQHNTVGPGNQIAFSGAAGVLVQGVTTLYNTITANGILDNGGQGIELTEGGNGLLPAPLIVSADPYMVAGTAEPGAIVEVFSGADDEGQNYEGEAVADPSGSFTFNAPLGMAGQTATATATDSGGNTSAFSAPYILCSTTLTVTSPLDSGPGTLRQALLDASGGDTITFDPGLFDPQNPLTITLLTDLPPLDQGQVTIDGSEAGVILDGQLIADNFCGLWVASDANTVRGVQFVGFDNIALCVDGRNSTVGGDRGQGSGPTGQGNQFGANYTAVAIWGDENAFLGNLVGTDASGGLAMGNLVGVGIQGAGNRIGGPTPGERNIVSANSFRGIFILGERARFNTVAGNYVGTDISGLWSLPNLNGVSMEIRASSNTIGGNTAAERNLISGNAEKGVMLSDAGSHNAVIGNWIGIDASGMNALGNTHGIFIGGVSFNRIGGTAPGEGNVISGNSSAIDVATPGYTDNLVLGNLIGVSADGSQPLGNGIGVGLHVNTRRFFVGGATPAEGNLIGANDIGVRVSVAGTEHNWILGNAIGTDAAGTLRLGNSEAGVLLEDAAAHTTIQGNAIANNGDQDAPRRAGVYIARSQENTIRRNSIHSNVGPGIYLTEGGNGLLPAPVVLTVTETTVSGTACPGCTVEIFSDDEDEGRIYEGSTVSDGGGDWTWAGDPSGPYLTVTATDEAGNTSAFSDPRFAGRHRIYLPLILRQLVGDSTAKGRRCE